MSAEEVVLQAFITSTYLQQVSTSTTLPELLIRGLRHSTDITERKQIEEDICSAALNNKEKELSES